MTMGERRGNGLQYPIRAVARMTGLSVDTLRAWERRYEAVVPGRSDRGRLYSDAHVSRLRRLGELVKRGHAIGTIATLPDAELQRLLERSETPPAAQQPPIDVDLHSLIAALERYDLDVIESSLNRYAVILPARLLVFAVVLPLLQELGRRWEAGTLRPSQEHLVSAIVRNVLGGLLRTMARPNAYPKVLFATLPGERHELGLLCAALLAASEGFGVVYLGADLPAADIVHAATTSSADVVMVSGTTPGIAASRQAKPLTALPPGVELWVGGPEAAALLAALGGRGRHVQRLAEVVPMLTRHAG